MNNYVAGHLENPDMADSCISVEFDPINGAIAYINEEEISLTYKQVRELANMVSRVQRQMEWDQAQWIYAHHSSGSKHHLMAKGAHGEREKTLCGAVPPSWGDYTSTWDISPVLDAPWRTDSMCKRCLAIYDKRETGGAA